MHKSECKKDTLLVWIVSFNYFFKYSQGSPYVKQNGKKADNVGFRKLDSPCKYADKYEIV